MRWSEFCVHLDFYTKRATSNRITLYLKPCQIHTLTSQQGRFCFLLLDDYKWRQQHNTEMLVFFGSHYPLKQVNIISPISASIFLVYYLKKLPPARKLIYSLQFQLPSFWSTN